MRKRTFVAQVVAAVLLGSVLAPGAASAEPCTPPSPTPLRFRPPVYVDQHRSGGEPVSIIADDGSIIVGAHLGTTLFYTRTVPEIDWASQYGNQTYVWRSTDDGQTFQRSEILSRVPLHTAMSTGLSDPDFAKDSAGNLYGTEINLANIAVFASHDNGITWPDGNPIADSGDRPWLTARGPGQVYLLRSGRLSKSTDGGATWTQLTTPPNAYGDIFVDPTDPQGLIVGTNTGIVVSRNDGSTWTSYPLPSGNNNGGSVMKSVGVHTDGWVSYGYITSGQVRFATWNPSTRAWSTPVTIPRVGNTAATPRWAWTVAGDSGRAAVGWYEQLNVGGSTNQVRVSVAVTENARGSTYTCPDGTEVAVPTRFSVADAARRPIHIGQAPCSGTGCNATGDRRLGDYFSINYDRLGRVFVTTGDTMLTNVADTQYMVSRPLFVMAEDESPGMLAG